MYDKKNVENNNYKVIQAIILIDYEKISVLTLFH